MQQAPSAAHLFDPDGLLSASRLRGHPVELSHDLAEPLEVRDRLWVLGSAAHIRQLADSRAAGRMPRSLWPADPAPNAARPHTPEAEAPRPDLDPLLDALRDEDRRAARRLSRELGRARSTAWRWMGTAMSPASARAALDGVAGAADVARLHGEARNVCAAADLVRPVALDVAHRLIGVEPQVADPILAGAAAFVGYSSHRDDLETRARAADRGFRAAREAVDSWLRNGRVPAWMATGPASVHGAPPPDTALAPDERNLAAAFMLFLYASFWNSISFAGGLVLHHLIGEFADDRQDGRFDPARAVSSALDATCPVPVFTLRTRAEVTVGSARIPKGSMVLCVVATANLTGADAPLTFGAGRFRCPGATLSQMVLAEIVAAFVRDGGERAWTPGSIAWQDGVMANPLRVELIRSGPARG